MLKGKYLIASSIVIERDNDATRAAGFAPAITSPADLFEIGESFTIHLNLSKELPKIPIQGGEVSYTVFVIMEDSAGLSILSPHADSRAPSANLSSPCFRAPTKGGYTLY